MKKYILSSIAISGGIIALSVNVAACSQTISYDGDNYYSSEDQGTFYMIKNDDTLWVTDLNKDGELSEYKKITDDVKSVCKGYIIKNDDTLWYAKPQSNEEENTDTELVYIMDDVMCVSKNNDSVLAVKKDGTLWGIGSNEAFREYEAYVYEEPAKLMNNVVKAEMGYTHSMILKSDGSLFTLGFNASGEIGIPDKEYRYCSSTKVMENVSDITAGESASYAIGYDNKLYRWGTMYADTLGKSPSDKDEPTQYITDVKAISPHYGFNLILKDDDTLWIYGNEDDEETDSTYFRDSEGTLKYLELQSLNLPIKIMDDVNSISEWAFMNDNTALILNNNRELFGFSLTHIDDGDIYKPQYSISKITDDVKLAEPIERKERTIYFKDISDRTIEEQKAINSLCKAGITEGTNETTFSPDKEVTRAETAALLLRMSAVPETDGAGFSDVTADNWYYGIASTSKKCGIVKGYEDNTFRGDENVSALQFISLNARVLRNERNIEADYTYDIPDNIPEWCVDDVKLALHEGLVTRDELEKLSDNNSITRAEAAVILYRLYDRI